MFNPWRIRPGTRGDGDDRLAEGGVGRRQHDPEDDGLPDGQHVEDRARRERSEGDRQRQPDSEQAQGHRDLAPQLFEVDPRGVGEEHERQRRLGQRPHG